MKSKTKYVGSSFSISRKEFLKRSTFGMGGLILGSLWAPSNALSKMEQSASFKNKPNILVIIADDAGWRDVGYHGSEIKTPVIDNLVNEGIELNNFYVCPTCSPTRAALLTGKYPSRFGILGPIGGVKNTLALPTDVINLASMLKQAGYSTALTGKWHLGLSPETGPNNYGFDYSYGYLHGQIDPYKHVYKYGDRTWHRNGEFLDEEGHATDLITNDAIKYISESRDESKPFYLHVAFNIPHVPLNEEKKWIEPFKESIENESRRMYAAAVAHLDHSIGRILDTLKKENLENDTIVIFLSDNGAEENWIPEKREYNNEYRTNDILGKNEPLRGWKSSLFDGAIRVPAVIKWPVKVKVKKIDDVLSVADILPTIAAFIGYNIPSDAKLDGKNFMSALNGNSDLKQREIYWRTKSEMAIRVGDWKLIHKGKKPDQGEDMLFNMKDDPYEAYNLADEKSLVVKMLKEKLHAVSKDDFINVKN